MEIFRYLTRLNANIFELNRSGRKELSISDDEMGKLQALMPMEIYLYEYAKQLH